jgi:hypothetical protein
MVKRKQPQKAKQAKTPIKAAFSACLAILHNEFYATLPSKKVLTTAYA